MPIAALLVAGCPSSPNPAREAIALAEAAERGTEQAGSAEAAAALYACPMHPEVTADAAGSCPECGMDLVAVAVVEELAPGPLWACPMHPEETAASPGVCSQCRMELVEVDRPETGEAPSQG